MTDDESSSTSCDKSDFNENPTRDALADGLISFMKPRVDNLNEAVEKVKENQKLLRSELDGVFSDLDSIFQDKDELSSSFQKYADKIAEMRHQMTVIDNVIQSARARIESFTGKINNLQKVKRQQVNEIETNQ